MFSRIHGWFLVNLRIMRVLRSSNPISLILKIFFLNALGKKRTIDVDVLGNKLKLRTATPDLYVAIETLGGEFEMLSSFPFTGPMFILDAGGYIGTASIALSSMYPNAVVLCVEPSSENFKILEQNIAKYSNIRALNAALVEEGGPEYVNLIETETGEWGFEVSTETQLAAPGIPTTTFSKIMREFNAERVQICKMDIEGGEEPLLRADDDWLSKTDALAIELHDRKRPGIDEAFWRSASGRLNLRLPGEKVLSLSPQFLIENYSQG